MRPIWMFFEGTQSSSEVMDPDPNRVDRVFHAVLILSIVIFGSIFLSGILRYLFGVQLNEALGWACFFCTALCVFLYRFIEKQCLIRVSGPALVTLGIIFLLTYGTLYTPYFNGLTSVGGGDAGNHIMIARDFVNSNPKAYFGFITFHAFVSTLERFFDISSFRSFRAAFYLNCFVFFLLNVLVAEKIRRDLNLNPRVFFVFFCIIWILFSFYAILPILHYNQANGYYGHIFGLLPLYSGFLFYVSSQSRLVRLAVLAVMVFFLRFTYGLNLPDTVLTCGVLFCFESDVKSDSYLLRPFVRIAGLSLIALGLYLYTLIYELSFVAGGFQSYNFLSASICYLLLISGVMFFGNRLASKAPSLLRAQRFVIVNAVIAGVIQALYASSSLPDGYYFRKYFLLPLFLLFTCSACFGAAWATGRYEKFRTNFVFKKRDPIGDNRNETINFEVSLHRRSLNSSGISICLLTLVVVLAADGFKGYRRSFWERIWGKPPWRSLMALSDPIAERLIREVIADQGKSFGGYIHKNWPLSNFMNASLGFHGSWEFFKSGEAMRKSGYCVFWNEGDRFESTFDAAIANNWKVLASYRALSDDKQKICSRYFSKFDPDLPIQLCHRCY